MTVDPTTAEQRHQRARTGRTVTRPCTEPDGMGSMVIGLPAADLLALDTALDGRRAASGPRSPTIPAPWSTCVPTSSPNSPCWTRDRLPRLLQLRMPQLSPVGNGARPPGHDRGHPGVSDRDRTGRDARRARRIRAHHGCDGATNRGRRDVAPPAHRSCHRRTARLRQNHVRPAAGSGRPRDRPRPVVPLRHLHLAVEVVRPRPHQSLPVGPTAAHDLAALHRGHHNAKTRRLWSLRQSDPGRFVWTSATGHVFDVGPEPIGPPLDGPGPPGPEPADEDPPPF